MAVTVTVSATKQVVLVSVTGTMRGRIAAVKAI